jgi:uncharacterized integral membrane protein (TIGR00698 family)
MESIFTTEGIGKKTVFTLTCAICLLPFVNGLEALLAGFLLVQFTGNPFEKYTHKAIKLFLQISVVGLGFGMNIHEALAAGKQGFFFTVASIFITLTIGLLLGRYFAIQRKTSLLIAAGTAICGGSAIAAVSPVIKANENEMSVSLGTIFILNAIALFIFPVVGHYFNLSQQQFGLWSAIAIHDTSSVVGAAHAYGPEALQIATAVKLERALWIIPVSICAALLFKNKQAKINIPWFILFFVLAMIISSMFPLLQKPALFISGFAKRCLVLTLFLIGTSLTKNTLKHVGAKPLLMGVLLWLFISVTSLFVIVEFV